MRLFKRPGDDRWRCAYRHPATGRWTERVLVKVKREAQRHAERLVREAEAKATGKHDSFAAARARPLREHLEDYLADIAARDRSETHLVDSRRSLTAILDATGWKTTADFDAAQLAGVLKRWRTVGTPRPGKGGRKILRPIGAEASNGRLRAAKSFEKWLADHGRVPVRRLSVVRPVKNDEPLHPRRALSAAELDRLFEAADRSEKRLCDYTGPERSTIYRFASVTGCRAGEIHALRPADFRDDGDSLVVTIRAKTTKNSKTVDLPVRSDVARRIRPLLLRTPHDAPIWPGTWRDNAARMVRADLQAAGLEYQDENGHFFDFHALRGQTATDHARGGTPMAVTQKLMRHSDPKLTARHYTHLTLSDLAKAVESTAPPAHTQKPGAQHKGDIRRA